MSGSYVLHGSILEKCGNFRKKGRFSGRIWPDWGNTTRADMAGLGSIGLKHSTIVIYFFKVRKSSCYQHPSLSYHVDTLSRTLEVLPSCVKC